MSVRILLHCTRKSAIYYTGNSQSVAEGTGCEGKSGREGGREGGCNAVSGNDSKSSVISSLTVLKDSLDVESVGGAGLVVSALLQVRGQLAGADVVDDARVVLRY